ncbi:hypothetical protein Tco_0479447 [Tanacetum coccineum]
MPSLPEIQGKRKRSLQAPLKTPPNLNISLSASLPMQRSQVILLKTQACNKIRCSSRETMMNNPLTRRLPKPTGSRNPSDLQLLILIGVRDDKLTFDLLRPGLVKLRMLKNLPLHLMSSMILQLISLHLNPLPLIQDHRGRQIIHKDYFINKDLEYLKGRDLSRRYSTSVTKTKAATYELKWIEDLVPELWSPVQLKYDQHAYLGTSHWGPKRQSFYGYASNLTSSKYVYSRRRIIAVTRLINMKKYDYGYLEEIEVHQDDQKLYTFKEGDFKRLRLQDIEDILLLLVQQKLTNLTIDERYDLNVASRMYTRRIVIQRRVEDLQLGIESYQKKLNLTIPNTCILNLRNKTAYTSHSDPHGIIYVDYFKRKRLTCADELHKFSDGTLNDVQTALHDIATGIRMEYLSMRKWSNLYKKRARVMVQDIDKQLYQRSNKGEPMVGISLGIHSQDTRQNQRITPEDIPLYSEEVLRDYTSILSTFLTHELVGIEKWQSAPRLRSLKPNRLILHSHSKDGNPALANIKQALEQYEHVGPEVTRSQEGKRSQDDDKRLCLVDDLKEFKITFMSSQRYKPKPKVKDHYINSQVKD